MVSSVIPYKYVWDDGHFFESFFGHFTTFARISAKKQQ
jgi:hypothetical protein